MVAKWKNHSEGTMGKFLAEMETVLRKYYSTDWEYQFEGEDGWVSLQMQIPSDKSGE